MSERERVCVCECVCVSEREQTRRKGGGSREDGCERYRRKEKRGGMRADRGRGVEVEHLVQRRRHLQVPRRARV